MADASAVLVIGLGFGDEGKGSIVDHLTRETKAHTVVRFNGGAQAAHHVVLDDGRWHCFAQFGSGTLAGARTHLSEHMIVNPGALLREGARLVELGIADAFDRITIEWNALVTTPLHIATNKAREKARGDGRHGSCGMGIGETAHYAQLFPEQALRIEDLLDPEAVRSKLDALSSHYLQTNASLKWTMVETIPSLAALLDTYAEFVKRVRIVGPQFLSDRLKAGTTIFEGAQGVLLDQDFGFHPYTTRSDCTFGNAGKLLRESAPGPITQRRIGVLRTYHTRHGAGPFPTEAAALQSLPEEHNGHGEWQGAFRRGHFDLVLAQYAAEVVGEFDEIALTHLDVHGIEDETRVCMGYEFDNEAPARIGLHPRRPADLDHQQRIGEELARAKPLYERVPVSAVIGEGLDTPIGIQSYGPRAADKRSVRR